MQNTQKWSPALMPPENSDITTWELPDGAIARLGQGIIRRDPAYSPCGSALYSEAISGYGGTIYLP